MSRVCTICSHEKRAEIEAAIVTGGSYRHIASQFGVGYKSVERHATEHIQSSVKQSQEAKEEARGLDVVKQLKDINTVTLAILQKAKDTKDKEWLALQAIDRVCKQLELQAKLLSNIDDNKDETINPSLMPYVTEEEMTTIKNVVERAKERKAKAEENIIPMRKHA